MNREFLVPAEIVVFAADQGAAEIEVLDFLRHGMKTCNDWHVFEAARLHETSDTIEIR